MPTTMYEAWVGDGKPWELTTPIREVRDRVHLAVPASRGLVGTLGDTAHLTSMNPQDHTPFSVTGWPVRHPYPYVNAVDIPHRPDLGLDCNKVAAHWLASAKAGLMPWLKYFIWREKRYDVRNNWVPVAASGHNDHLHGSGRTDHTKTSIGSWHPLPGYGDADMDATQIAELHYLHESWKYEGRNWTAATLQAINRIEPLLNAIAGKVDLDPAELEQIKAAAAAGARAGVLESAEEIAAAIPDELAADVADLLAARLAS